MICPICKKGILTEVVERVYYGDLNIELDLHYSVCNYCLSEQADSRQLKLNKENMIKARFKVI